MYQYTYEAFIKDIDALTPRLKEIDAVVSIARGGVTFGHFLSERLGLRTLFSLNAISYDGQVQREGIDIFNIPDLKGHMSILLVDDISDSGKTLEEVVHVLQKKYPKIQIQTATLFYKESSCFKPDYYMHIASEWIGFFWDKK